MQVELKRDHLEIPWGFKFKGGTDHKSPLSIIKVIEGSPSHCKLECGDLIQSIGKYPALSLSHEQALNLIRMFDLTLPLLVQRPTQHQQKHGNQTSQMNQPFRVGPISMNKPVAAVWKPPSQAATAGTASPQPYQQYQQYQPQQYQQSPHQQQQQHYQPQQQYHHQPQQQYHHQNQNQYNNQYQPQAAQQQYQYNSPSSSSHQYQQQSAPSPSVYHQYQPQHSTASTFANVPSSPRTPAAASASYYHQPSSSSSSSNVFSYPSSSSSQHHYHQQNDDYNQRPASYQYQPSINVMSGPAATSTTGMPSSLLMMNTAAAHHSPSQMSSGGVPNSPRLMASSSAGSISPIAAPPPAPPPPPPPPAPPLPTSFNSVNNYRASQASTASSSNTGPSDAHARTSGAVPDALLKALNASPMGKKPFTYTPGGLDLSHVRQSARVRRYESMNSGERVQHGGGPQQNFSPNYESYQKQSTSQTSLNTAGMNYNYMPGGAVSVQAPSAMAAHQRLNSASMNNFETGGMTPPPQAPRLQRQTSGSGGSGPMGFSVTPDQLARSRNMIKQQQHDDEPKDMYNQSFSFKMLNKWISESETQPIQLRSKKDEEEEKQQQQQQQAPKKSEVARAIEEEERRGFVRSSQSPQTGMHVQNQRMNVVPSKTFQYVDRKFSESDSGPQSMRRASQSGDEYNYSAPARERDQENQPPKYRGTNIPSRAFKYLQYLTQNEIVTDEKPQQQQPASTDQPANKPVLRTAADEVAPPERLNALGRKNSIEYQQQAAASAAATSSAQQLYQQQQHVLKSMTSGAAVTSTPSNLHANANNNSLESNASAPEPNSKLLGVKSMMNRFNNISSSNPQQTQPSYQRAPNSATLINNSFTETASTFHNMPSQPQPSSSYPFENQKSHFSPPASEKSEPKLSSPLPTTSSADVTSAAAETLAEPASLLNGDREEVKFVTAKVEIAETTADQTIGDDDSISLTPSASIVINETINTDINLNAKNEQQKQQQQETAAAAAAAATSAPTAALAELVEEVKMGENVETAESSTTTTTTTNVQEEQAVQQISINETRTTTSNEVAQKEEEVIETSEF